MFYDHDESSYATDEPIPNSEPKKNQSSNVIFDKIKIATVYKEKVPSAGTNLRVLLELEGNGSKDDQPGVDIVVVLDVSGSMKNDNKLEKMTGATKFLIDILTEKHRLSLVSFSTNAVVRCPLRPMTAEAKYEIGCQVDDFKASGGTNIFAGLELALNILKSRRYSRGRVPAIILLTDGEEDSIYADATPVEVKHVPVFTIGLGNGKEYNPEVLSAIANNSMGGTFSVVDIQNEELNEDPNKESNLRTAFALCLGWLLTVVVQDLQMTITTVQSGVKINSVLAGYYPIARDDYTATIQLGNLCNLEKRSLLVDLDLPAVTNEGDCKALEITYSYLYDGEPFDSKPEMVTVFRTTTSTESLDDKEKIEVHNEEKRIELLGTMKQAIGLADQGNFDEAVNKLQQAQRTLDDLNNPVTKALKFQLEQFMGLMDPFVYRYRGRHITLSVLSSHYRQREAITNNDLTNSSLFANQAMVEFADNVKSLTKVEPSEKIFKLINYFQGLLKAR